MGHNSRWCESGGEEGHPVILSMSRTPPPLKKNNKPTEGGNQILRSLCGGGKKKNRLADSLSPTHSLGKRKTVFTIIITDTTPPVQAFLSQAITFSFPPLCLRRSLSSTHTIT